MRASSNTCLPACGMDAALTTSENAGYVAHLSTLLPEECATSTLRLSDVVFLDGLVHYLPKHMLDYYSHTLLAPYSPHTLLAPSSGIEYGLAGDGFFTFTFLLCHRT